MTEMQKKQLLKAQQGELDAVLLYKKLANAVKGQEKKEKLLKVAAEEGNHAAILRQYTGETLKPKAAKSLLILALYKVLGEKKTMKILANGEMKSIGSYAPLSNEFPNIKSIMADEERHAKVALSIIENN